MPLSFLIPMSVATALGTALLVAAYVRWAKGRGVLDVPNARSSHVRPTPRGGGLVIVVLTLAAVAVYALWHAPADEVGPVVAFVASGALIAAVSWVDDLKTLGGGTRFAVHGAAAAVLIAGAGYWESIALPGVGTVPFGPAGAVLTVVWLVGATNFYNFMDGIDGIAGGQAVVAGLGWAVLGFAAGSEAAGVAGLLLAATTAGFLSQNWSPAKVFMGDVGSAFLGFSFAALPVLFAATSSAGAAGPGDRLPLAAALFIWPFLTDATFTLLRRLRRGENIFAAHRTHLYQRLVAAGAGHASVAGLYAAYAVCTTTAGGYWALGLPGGGTVVVAVVALLGAAHAGIVRTAERRAASADRVHRAANVR